MLLSKKTSCFIPDCNGEMKREEFPPAKYDYMAEGPFSAAMYEPGEAFAQLYCTKCNATHKFYNGQRFVSSYHYPNGLVRLY